ncbi:MAG: myo-inosose-2 dehydratase [Spirochaetes bacterium]|nr:MAG: myo-inosose-2 dehydratase [Spirochaetota bacterium]
MLNKENIRLGIAPIGWTNDDIPELGGENTFQQCISEMALAGFTGSEVGSKYPADPQELKKALDLRGLVICNQWFSAFTASRPMAEVEKEFRDQMDFLRVVGSDVIGPSEQTRSSQGNLDIGVAAGKAELSGEEWKKMTTGFNRLGRTAKDEGFKLCFHHHMGTGVQTPVETERFLNDTDPSLVYLTFDSGHFAYTGADPVAELKKFISRVGHVHLKDVRPDIRKMAVREDWPFMKAVREGVFTVPGDGSVDFPSIFKLLGEADYRGWMVVEAEQDPAKANPFEYALKARDYIREQTGL